MPIIQDSKMLEMIEVLLMGNLVLGCIILQFVSQIRHWPGQRAFDGSAKETGGGTWFIFVRMNKK